MKRIITALVAGVVLGSTGVGIAASQEIWVRNGVMCTPTGKGKSRGVVCWVEGSKKLAVVSQNTIMVGNQSRVLYLTSSR